MEGNKTGALDLHLSLVSDSFFLLGSGDELAFFAVLIVPQQLYSHIPRQKGKFPGQHSKSSDITESWQM